MWTMDSPLALPAGSRPLAQSRRNLLMDARWEDAVRRGDVEAVQAQLRAGVHLGKPRKIGGDYLGVDVNVAARVASAAKPGEILVSGTACAKLDERVFELKRKRRFKAKGAPKELEVFAVERVG